MSRSSRGSACNRGRSWHPEPKRSQTTGIAHDDPVKGNPHQERFGVPAWYSQVVNEYMDQHPDQVLTDHNGRKFITGHFTKLNHVMRLEDSTRRLRI